PPHSPPDFTQIGEEPKIEPFRTAEGQHPPRADGSRLNHSIDVRKGLPVALARDAPAQAIANSSSWSGFAAGAPAKPGVGSGAGVSVAAEATATASGGGSGLSSGSRCSSG